MSSAARLPRASGGLLPAPTRLARALLRGIVVGSSGRM
jgi:hypothetical protein